VIVTRAAVSSASVPLEVGELFELVVARVDFFARERAEAVNSEPLAAVAAHHGAEDHGPVQFRLVEVRRRVEADTGQIAEEAAGEAIARRYD
jgi:hypothetical protein